MKAPWLSVVGGLLVCLARSQPSEEGRLCDSLEDTSIRDSVAMIQRAEGVLLCDLPFEPFKLEFFNPLLRDGSLEAHEHRAEHDERSGQR